ncbi:MAG: hypothetical protein HY922_04160 [Elusimicrobia bacterium]|nr:hypothetical protein [Elusimicrobiota bacterium]
MPKKTITVYTVSIAKPTGDPVAAGSANNEFTYASAGGVVLIPVEATVQPTRLATKVGDMIKWTLVSVPAGSALTWNNPWPGEATAGHGVTAVATLTGYPTSNSQFGPRTIKMEVIRNGKAIITKTANIELFFERDAIATGRAVPNWFFLWRHYTVAEAPNLPKIVIRGGRLRTTASILRRMSSERIRRRSMAGREPVSMRGCGTGTAGRTACGRQERLRLSAASISAKTRGKRSSEPQTIFT